MAPANATIAQDNAKAWTFKRRTFLPKLRVASSSSRIAFNTRPQGDSSSARERRRNPHPIVVKSRATAPTLSNVNPKACGLLIPEMPKDPFVRFCQDPIGAPGLHQLNIVPKDR